MKSHAMSTLSILMMGAAFLLAGPGRPVHAYSVFTHEELIDLVWTNSIQPLLLARFPNATDQQMIEAHAYAYGGCTIQDMGYYPFAQKFFSDLTHYVRSGDFVASLLNDASSLDEYAFALGALSHYLGDSIGHAEAVNLATPIAFPKLARKYGASVAYDQDPHAHVRTEFGFDIDQLSKRTFAPPAYLQHIGFKVPRILLDRAFVETYGLRLPELIGKTRPALRSYRTSVRTFIPVFSEAEVVLHGRQFPSEASNQAYRRFADRLMAADYERHWKTMSSAKPGIRAHILAVIVKLLPKVGVISLLAIKVPEPKTEELYVESVNKAVDTYTGLLRHLRDSPDANLALENFDLDTGEVVKSGTYRLTDKTYAKLTHRLMSRTGSQIPEELRQNILSFYSDPDARNFMKNDADAWQHLQSEISSLRRIPESGDPGTPTTHTPR